MLSKDPEEKLRRGYVEKDSFVRLDGSEVLKQKDWLFRVHELWSRSGGQCEYRYEPNGARCQQRMDDPHHIKPRSKGRDDRLSNLQALCRYHHNLLDKRKIGGRK